MDNFPYLSMKTYVVGIHLNRLIEMVQMSTHNMFSLRDKKNYPWIITNLLLLVGPLPVWKNQLKTCQCPQAICQNLTQVPVIFLGMRPASCTHNFARGHKISLGESRGLIKFSNVRTFCFFKSTFIFGKSECASGVSVPCLVKASTERRRISTVHRFYLYSQKSIPSCPVPEETVAETKVLVFSLLRTSIVTPTLTSQLSTGNSDRFLFPFFFWKKKTMHPKKIIKLEPLQQTLFGLLRQQIRLTRTTKSVTADDGDLDNGNPQFQTEPTKQRTKKSLLCITV